MSKNYDKTFAKEPEGQTNNSVLDFLYHDAQRVGSFLAQFDDAGHLQQITQGESAGKKEQRVVSLSARAGIPAILGGQLIETDKVGEEGSETSRRVYDPLWTNARTLLDYLNNRGIIQRDLGSASIGQFVLVTGRIEIIDLAMFVNIWDDKQFQNLMSDNAGEEGRNPRSSGRKKSGPHNRNKPPGMDIALLLLKMLPHAIQMTILGEDKAWCNLLRSGLICTTGDLLLMHGGELEGEWHVLGILDSRNDEAVSPLPDDDNNPVPDDDNNADVEESAGVVTSAFKNIMPIGKLLLGRPSDAYGLTPLIIFREIVEQ